MKTIKHIYLPVRTLLILVMSVIFCGCTHNNGDIGVVAFTRQRQ